MNRMFLNLEPPIHLPDSIVSVKKFVKELSVLSGKSWADVFGANSIVNDSFVK